MGQSIRAILFLALFLLAPSSGIAQSQDPACAREAFEGSHFTVCRFNADRDALRLAVRDASGKAYGRLPALRAALGNDASRVRFAMNAGMFDALGAPIGLFIENGREVHRLNLRNGAGNFHLNPNGVFWVNSDGDVAVSTSDDYARAKPKAAWATQSGPMLVIDGSLHPAFSADGASRLIRNGVGVTGKRTAVFVISDDGVSFGRFARFFRDALGANNALYLDGVVSSLWAPQLNRMDSTRDLGPILIAMSP